MLDIQGVPLKNTTCAALAVALAMPAHAQDNTDGFEPLRAVKAVPQGIRADTVVPANTEVLLRMNQESPRRVARGPKAIRSTCRSFTTFAWAT